MKKHGLWIWHRALAASLRNNPTSPARLWWAGDAEVMERAYRAVNYHAQQCLPFGGISTKQAILIRCANRYVRRFLTSATAQEWNQVVERIASRADSHQRTVDSVLIKESNPVFAERKTHSTHEFLRPNMWNLPAQEKAFRDEWRRQRDEAATKEKAMKDAMEAMARAYEHEQENPWCDWPNDRAFLCTVCGQPAYYTRHNCRGPNGKRYTETLFGRGMHEKTLACRSRLCQFIARSLRPTRKENQDEYLARLLNEAAKHKGDNPLNRGLAKHFARNPGRLC